MQRFITAKPVSKPRDMKTYDFAFIRGREKLTQKIGSTQNVLRARNGQGRAPTGPSGQVTRLEMLPCVSVLTVSSLAVYLILLSFGPRFWRIGYPRTVSSSRTGNLTVICVFGLQTFSLLVDPNALIVMTVALMNRVKNLKRISRLLRANRSSI